LGLSLDILIWVFLNSRSFFSY